MAINWNARRYTKEEFIEAWNSSLSIAEVARKLDCNKNGSGYSTLKRAADALGLTKDHMLGQGHLKGKTHNWTPSKPLEEVLVENNYVSSSGLKKRLFKEGVLTPVCSICGITEWLGKPAPLSLDHISGDNTDNRLENLRILCYNCHGQTETFCRGNTRSNSALKEICPDCGGYKHTDSVRCKDCAPKARNGKSTRVRAKNPSPSRICPNCGGKKSSLSKMCASCYSSSGKRVETALKHNKTKIEWPSDEDLAKMLKESNYYALGKKLGVSDNAVRKRCKTRGIVLD